MKSPAPGLSSSRRSPVLLLVLAFVAIQLFALRDELRVNRVNVNDNILHSALLERMVEAFEGDENPVDFWVSEWALGYPVPRTYQPLGYLIVATVYFGLGKSVDLMLLFSWIRYLLVCLLPLTVYFSARQMMLRPKIAAAAAILVPLISTNRLFGIEYGSSLWLSSGLYTQSWAVHFLFLTLGFSFQAIRRGRRVALCGVLLALTFLAHFIYGYIGALSIVLLALLPERETPLGRRLTRLGFVALLALAGTAFQLVPMLLDSAVINKSRFEPVWKWNSFGAKTVLEHLVSGRLLDYGRFPSLSLCALLGALSVGVGWVSRERWHRFLPGVELGGDERRSAVWVLSGGFLWLILFFGRSTWGVLFDLLGAHEALHVHRFVGGVQVFLILLGGIGLGLLWERLWPSLSGSVLAVVLTLLVLAPALRERAVFLAKQRDWGRTNLTAYEAERADLEAVVEKTAQRPGRAFPGLASTWGSGFRVGYVPLYGFLGRDHVATISFLYHSMALTSEVLGYFDQENPDHYRLFNVETVIAEKQRLPSFLLPETQIGRFRLLRAPSPGYFEVVSVPYRAHANKRNFYDVNRRWLESDWLPKGQYLLLDFPGTPGGGELPRSSIFEPLPDVEEAAELGRVESESRAGELYTAQVHVDAEEAFLLFKMTYHPNWRVTVDGEEQPTVMLSPGLLGVALEPGLHSVECRYRPEGWKNVLLVLALPLLALGGWLEKRGLLVRLESRAEDGERRFVRWLRDGGWTSRRITASGLLLLALPVCLPLLTDRLPGGHDVFTYLPRIVEFDQDVSHGNLLPRWAPDLSSGFGQPFFIFAPPLLYYLSQIGLFLGFGLVTALNAACILVVVGSAAGMYLLGKLCFGRTGGWLAATAYLYAPYYHADLFVRAAFAELTTFAFFPLALYGFVRYAGGHGRRFLLVSALSYAAIVFSHPPASLLFSPLLAAFVVFNAWRIGTWRSLLEQGLGLGLGLGLSAAIWLPALVEKRFTKIGTLLEGYLDYANHFVYPHQFFFSPWGYGLSHAGYEQDGISHALGWSHLLLIVALLLGLRPFCGRATRVWAGFFSAAVLLMCFVMTPAAAWLWDRLPLLQYVQFSWRLMAPVTVCIALLVAALGEVVRGFPGRPWWVAGLLALLILPNLSHIGPESYFEIDPEDWTPQEIARRSVRATTTQEYEPLVAVEPPPYRAERIRLLEGKAEVLDLETTPIRWSMRVVAESDVLLEASTFGFPGWRLESGGRELPMQLAPQTGLVRFQLPAGEHHVRLVFGRTPVRWTGEGLSLLCLAFVVGLWLWERRRSGLETGPPATTGTTRGTATTGGEGGADDGQRQL